MRLRIDHQGIAYVPLRAVPLITGGFFSATELPRLLGFPDEYCDHSQAVTLSAFLFDELGVLRPIEHGVFRCIAVRNEGRPLLSYEESLREIPAGAVVPESDLKSIFLAIREAVATGTAAGSLAAMPIWNIAPCIPEMHRDIVFQGFLPEQFTECVRANSRAIKLVMLERVIARIERYAIAQGIPFDKTEMPGIKRQLIAALRVTHQKHLGASSTMDDYFHEIGLRWPQGAKPLEPYWPQSALQTIL